MVAAAAVSTSGGGSIYSTSMVPVGWGLLIRMPDATHTLLPNRMNFAATLRCVAPWSLRCAVFAAAALASASTADLTATSVGVTKFWYR